MNISGIVVSLVPSASCLEALRSLPGVEVHRVEAGRAVVTQETDDQEEGLRRIQALPGVLHAELVYHWFEEAP